MLTVFELYITKTADPTTLLSDEMKEDTGAVVMTIPEAEALGFAGFRPQPGKRVRIVAVRGDDTAWVARSFEMNDDVVSFQVHQVDG